MNKTYFAGEYDWVGRGSSDASDGDSSTSLWYRTIEQTPGAIGSAFWSLFGHNVPDCSVSTLRSVWLGVKLNVAYLCPKVRSA